MVSHRTAQRLRVLDPVLLSHNKRQPKKSQELTPSDFDGSWFDRWLCQGSGQHPLTGSPQHQRAFFIGGRSGERFAACCSGALAVLSGVWGRAPVTGHYHYQNLNHGLVLGAGPSALVNWLTWPSNHLIWSVALARSALSWLTSSLSVATISLSLARAVSTTSGSSSSGNTTKYLNPPGPVIFSTSYPKVFSRISLRIDDALRPSFHPASTIDSLGISLSRACLVSISYQIITLGYQRLSAQDKQLLAQLTLARRCHHG